MLIHASARMTRRSRALLIWLCLLLLSAGGALAQDTGQICLGAFADDNGNGRRDELETPITRGVAASLLNDRGITIASLLLADSPYADDGLLCFDGLLAGNYQVVASSSQYQATTATSARASVRPGTAPARIDFGARRLVGEYIPDPAAMIGALDQAAQQALLVAGLAAAGAIVALSLLGVVVYVKFFRRRRRRRAQRSSTLPPAGLPPEESDDYLRPRQRLHPNRGSPLLFADDEQELVGSSKREGDVFQARREPGENL